MMCTGTLNKILSKKKQKTFKFCSANRKKAVARKTSDRGWGDGPQIKLWPTSGWRHPRGKLIWACHPPGHKCLHQMQVYTYVFYKYIPYFLNLYIYIYPHPTVVDGVICLVQPPTETIEHPAAVSIPYSDLAQMVVQSNLKQFLFLHYRRRRRRMVMMMMKKHCLVPQGEIQKGLLKCVLMFCYWQWSTNSHAITLLSGI